MTFYFLPQLPHLQTLHLCKFTQLFTCILTFFLFKSQTIPFIHFGIQALIFNVVINFSTFNISMA